MTHEEELRCMREMWGSPTQDDYHSPFEALPWLFLTVPLSMGVLILFGYGVLSLVHWLVNLF